MYIGLWYFCAAGGRRARACAHTHSHIWINTHICICVLSSCGSGGGCARARTHTRSQTCTNTHMFIYTHIFCCGVWWFCGSGGRHTCAHTHTHSHTFIDHRQKGADNMAVPYESNKNCCLVWFAVVYNTHLTKYPSKRDFPKLSSYSFFVRLTIWACIQYMCMTAYTLHRLETTYS